MSNTSKNCKRKVVCPKCGTTNSQVWIDPGAQAHGIWVKCKGCKTEFEIKVP